MSRLGDGTVVYVNEIIKKRKCRRRTSTKSLTFPRRYFLVFLFDIKAITVPIVKIVEIDQ